MRTRLSSLTLRVVAVVVGTALLVGTFGVAVGAAPFSPAVHGMPPEGMEPGLDGPPAFAAERAPQLTEEQERHLERIRAIVEELAEIVRQASTYAAHESWVQVQVELLDYVSTLVTLEQVIDALVATFPEGRFPARLMAPLMGALGEQARELAGVWEVLPEANREPVRRAVEAAAAASDHPRFWGLMVRIVSGNHQPPDPGATRERLERMLARAEEHLARTLERMERLEEAIANLEQRIEECEDETQLERLEDLKHLAELDLAVCEAQVARDEFAIESLEERLAELGD